MELEEVVKIENYELRLYRILAEELSDGEKRVDYAALSDKLGCSRSTVSRNVGKLLSAGIIGVSEGKLFLK